MIFRKDPQVRLAKSTTQKTHHDRIDFVFFGGGTAKIKHCEIVSEDGKFADIVVQPYPSDHRAAVATVEIP